MTHSSSALPGRDWIELTDVNGNLNAPLASKGWLLPAEVIIRNSRLIYDYLGSPPRTLVRANPCPSLLAEFVRLADCPEQEIAAFAKRRGVLGVCRHGLPYPHEALTGDRPWNRVVNCFPGKLRRRLARGGQPHYWLWEPLSAWQRYARVARATLNLVAALRQGRSGRREDWLVITPLPPVEAEAIIPSLDQNPWHYINSVLTDWFSAKPATLSFSLSDSGELTSDVQRTNSLFEYLRLQLAFAVGRGGGLALCADCGQLYRPRRRPNPNRLSFCLKCGRAAAMRVASRRYRQRRRPID